MKEYSVFPLPLWLHIVFAVVGLAFYGYMYYTKRKPYHLLLALAIPSTLLVYLCQKGTAFVIFGIEQFAMLILIFITIAVSKKKEKELEKLETKGEEQDENKENKGSNA